MSGPPPLHIMIVDDDLELLSFLRDTLEDIGYQVSSFHDPKRAHESLLERDVDVLITDMQMKGMSGMELCASIHELRPELPILVLTAFGTLELAVASMRAGAFDFLSKPIDLDMLEWSVARAAEQSRLRTDLHALQAEPVLEGEEASLKAKVWGDSPAVQRARERLMKAARVEASVCVTGETGTGKELAARALHEGSSRASEPFIAVNCAAIPEALLESELFGHTKGAFTDAKSARQGLFLQAQGGTLFLDELGELPLSLQPKLLRVLQEGRVRPVGSDVSVEVRCRVVCATNIDLRRAVEEGRFRGDLYYRIAVIRISLPPLRERVSDILSLAQRFGARAAQRLGLPSPTLSVEVARALTTYTWPGNIRELENCMEYAVAMGTHSALQLDDLPEELLSRVAQGSAPPSSNIDDSSQSSQSSQSSENAQGRLLTLEELEQVHIQRALELTEGNKSLAAQLLGIDRSTLYRKLTPKS